jgi:nucleoside triphosphatase
MRPRVIVVPLLRDRDGAYLLCKMPRDRGAYPGQWGLPGGGVEPGERMADALRRETREELGLELHTFEPLLFGDAVREKLQPDGGRERVYMIFLVFLCTTYGSAVTLNDELESYAWVPSAQLISYDLNDATLDTFRRAGLLPAVAGAADEASGRREDREREIRRPVHRGRRRTPGSGSC